MGIQSSMVTVAAERVDLKGSPQTHRILYICAVMDAIVMIILNCIQTLNHYVVNLKATHYICQLYLNLKKRNLRNHTIKMNRRHENETQIARK